MRTTPILHLRRREAGSSLIEVLIACAIVGTGLLGLILGQTRAGIDLRQSQWRTNAHFLAIELAEQVRGYGPSGLPAARLSAWQERVDARLPDGDGTIEWSAVAGGGGTVILTWRLPGQAAGAEFRYPFRP